MYLYSDFHGTSYSPKRMFSVHLLTWKFCGCAAYFLLNYMTYQKQNSWLVVQGRGDLLGSVANVMRAPGCLDIRLAVFWWKILKNQISVNVSMALSDPCPVLCLSSLVYLCVVAVWPSVRLMVERSTITDLKVVQCVLCLSVPGYLSFLWRGDILGTC